MVKISRNILYILIGPIWSKILASQGRNPLKDQQLLPLAALLHDIGKFRQRATDRYKPHQEHSYEFVNEDFAEFFASCGDTFKNAIRHHHRKPDQLQHLIEKQVILADRLSATEREDEEREAEDFVGSPLVSILSRLKGANKEFRYQLTALNLENRDTIIPSETAEVSQKDYEDLWKEFTDAFRKATDGKAYEPRYYQTIVALLHKWTSRIPSATPWGDSDEKVVPDISLYDHLRTTAAIAACIGREFTTDTEVDEELKVLSDQRESDRNICALIKGDISGIQTFLYQILSHEASNQLRGRSFYLQLLTEAIAQWVLRQFGLPITNLLLASGGHFYILAPYTEAREKLDTLRQQISEKLWELHRSDISCMLAGIPIKARDFKADNFTRKWKEVAEKVNERKQQKWSEMGAQGMYQNLFVPQQTQRDEDWKFEELGKQLRHATYLITYQVPETQTPDVTHWRDAIKTFELDAQICTTPDDCRELSLKTEHVTVYRLGDADFLSSIENFQWKDASVSYDFKPFRPVIAQTDAGQTADYDDLAEASQGVKWFGALRMDIDNLGDVFKDRLENATISRHATLSRELSLFFEGYVPQLCKAHNKNRKKEILELIYAGGDDLFLVGGWSALPEITTKIRSEFRNFVTGDHVTLSGGIVIEHKKFPLYQFADISGTAEGKAKSLRRVNADGEVIKKDAITFLQKPMSWDNFDLVSEWHHKFMNMLAAEKSLPQDFLTRLNQIYGDKKRWAWRSIYYFHRLQQQHKDKTEFIEELRQTLNHETDPLLREFIQVITRWTALHIRKS